jgi:hypothetical protein
MIRTALLVALASSPAMAEGPARPASLQGLLAYHQTTCATQGGTLTIAEDAVTETKLNGDGQTDFILDSSKLACSGSPAMFCVAETGCELNVFVGEAQHTIIVKSWSLKKAGDRQHLVATIDKDILNLPLDLTSEMSWDDANAALTLVTPQD